MNETKLKALLDLYHGTCSSGDVLWAASEILNNGLEEISIREAQGKSELFINLCMESILLETDSPFVRLNCTGVSRNQLRRARNTSLILPLVIERISELKGLSNVDVEQVTARTAEEVFHFSESRKGCSHA